MDNAGTVTISGTRIRRNGGIGVMVLGEATIKDSGVTASGRSGVFAWKRNGECKAICTIGDYVENSGNVARNDPYSADYVTRADGQLPGAPQERVLTMT